MWWFELLVVLFTWLRLFSWFAFGYDCIWLFILVLSGVIYAILLGWCVISLCLVWVSVCFVICGFPLCLLLFIVLILLGAAISPVYFCFALFVAIVSVCDLVIDVLLLCLCAYCGVCVCNLTTGLMLGLLAVVAFVNVFGFWMYVVLLVSLLILVLTYVVAC